MNGTVKTSKRRRSFGHWSFRYAVDRVRWALYERRNMDRPWLTPQANELLSMLLRPGDVGLEWGSGRSTCWFARAIRHLTSVENDPQWHAKVAEQIANKGIRNVDYRLLPIENRQHDPQSAYVRVVDSFADDSLDFALVDGQSRAACALAVIAKLSPGGLLVVDNANWYLDRPSRSPQSRHGKGPVDSNWAEFEDRVKDWRAIWTSSGVTDTAMWFKPPAGR